MSVEHFDDVLIERVYVADEEVEVLLGLERRRWPVLDTLVLALAQMEGKQAALRVEDGVVLGFFSELEYEILDSCSMRGDHHDLG